MAIPNNAVKVVMGGGLPGGESWSTSFWLMPQTALGQIDLTNVLQELDTDFAAGGGLYHGLSLVNPAQVTLKTLLGYQYQGGSKAAVQAVYNSTYTPSATAPTLTNQTAVVASLRTGAPGRSRRGRMYFPCLLGTIATTGLASSVNIATFCSGIAQSFGTFNASGFGKIVVCSPTTSATAQVNQIVMDHVLDTQRRRRDKLVDPSPALATVSE